jgi:hypothetical protein
VSETDPFSESSFYDLLSEDQKEVCRELYPRFCEASGLLLNAWYRIPPRDAPWEIDALLGIVKLDSYYRAKDEEIGSLPPLGFYEADFSVSSAFDSIRERLPFSDRELVLLHQTAPKWNEEIGNWYEYPDKDEHELIARWQDWLFEPQATVDELIASEDPRIVTDHLDKLFHSLWALVGPW